MSLQTEVTRLQGIKGDIQTALVNKGVSGAGSHTMSQFATDIAGISTGTDVSDTTATASDVLSGKAFYLANGTKANGTIGTGALSTPTVNSSGLVTASVGTTGYMTSGTSSTLQLSTQSAKTVTPSTSSQTAVASGRYTTGAVTVSAMPSGALSTPTVNSTGLVTASVGTSGYLASGTSKTTQLSTVASQTITPSSSSFVVAVAKNKYTTGIVYVEPATVVLGGELSASRASIVYQDSTRYLKVTYPSITATSTVYNLNCSFLYTLSAYSETFHGSLSGMFDMDYDGEYYIFACCNDYNAMQHYSSGAITRAYLFNGYILIDLVPIIGGVQVNTGMTITRVDYFRLLFSNS